MRKNKDASFVNLGLSSLLIVFLVLCLVVFATLSLSTAKNTYSFSERISERKQQFYFANNIAEEICQKIDGEEEHSSFKYDHISVEFLSDKYYAFQIPVGEDQILDVLLEVLPVRPGEHYYEVRKWQLVSTKEWNGDQTLNVIQLDN